MIWDGSDVQVGIITLLSLATASSSVRTQDAYLLVLSLVKIVLFAKAGNIKKRVRESVMVKTLVLVLLP